MKRLAMMATFALLSTGAAAFQAAGRPEPFQTTYPCGGPNCATNEPVVTNPQGAPEPAPFQTAAPCDNPGCALLCANWRCA